jgi:hypothetical protein
MRDRLTRTGRRRPAPVVSRVVVSKLVVALVVVAAMSIISACGTGPVSLSLNSGAVSDCYRGLPAARDALHDKSAKLTGVHRVPYDTLHKRFPSIAMPPSDDDTEVCVFAFTGDFVSGQVTGAPGSEQGPVAVVVISSKKLTLVNSWVGNRLPKSYGRRVAQ